MPPTLGHLQLIQFASELADQVVVVLNTQPREPFPQERVDALKMAIKNHQLDTVTLIHYDKAIEQDPSTPGFWEMWKQLMYDFGVRKNDYIVASEKYGKKLAEVTGATFYPYDIDRSINDAKATPVRANVAENFADILPEFQPTLKVTVTIFGAESTGKTTLSKQLAERLGGYFIFEYARPYLENTVNEITVDSMTAIWRGQKALQQHALKNLPHKPFVLQDTDLFSTVGYWQQKHWQKKLGTCPQQLIDDARRLISDLYIVTKSNIPFEQDPLRYGGNMREASDEYWMRICMQQQLPLIVLDSSDPEKRIQQAMLHINKAARKKFRRMSYDRGGL